MSSSKPIGSLSSATLSMLREIAVLELRAACALLDPMTPAGVFGKSCADSSDEPLPAQPSPSPCSVKQAA